MGDLGRRAAAHGADAGQLPQLVQHLGGLGLGQVAEQGGEAAAGAGFGLGLGAGQLGLEAAARGEGALQPRLHALGQVERRQEGAEQGHVAQHQLQVVAAAGAGGGPGQGGEFGVLARGALNGVWGLAVQLHPDLQELHRPVLLLGQAAEGLALVQVAALRGVAGQVGGADGDGEVGTQAGLGRALALDHEQPPAHGLAGQVEQQGQGLQHRRIDPHAAERLEGRADGSQHLGRQGGLDRQTG